VDHLGVNDVALFKCFVQFQLADHAAQAGLGQLRDRHDVVGRAVARQLGVRDLKVQDAVDLQLCVVARDADLAGHVERDFFEAVFVSHFVDEGHQEVQAWGQGAVVFTQSLHDPSALLGHHFDGAGDEDGGDDQQCDGDFHGVSLCWLWLK